MGLKSLRLKRGLTQQQLADKIDGLTASRVSDWETGQRDIGRMSLGMACSVADALHVSNPRRLLDDDES